MTRQNRVDPFAIVRADPAKGLFFGNRGGSFMRLDGSLKQRHWASRQWIICTLTYKDRRHEIDNPKHYTGLFFLDEASALAAGHRPCFLCRREAAVAFRAALVSAGRIQAGDGAGAIDHLLAGEVQSVLTGESVREIIDPQRLPSGAFFAVEDTAYLKSGDAARPWSFAGYGMPERLQETGIRLTPRAACDALAAGYRPVLHPSALS